ncbi:hypothetical protein BKA66DRAFT_263485 [Pyrenochaeta sp. MPI-SDFR-AT-0127]|nr:hypothetical protein BKA66DRAFT_263485 [Pyrenochaeta sp. MPI-SDFR-AT-0127]
MSSQHPIPRKLWQHANPKSTAMWKFMQRANRKRGLNMQPVDLRLALAELLIDTKCGGVVWAFRRNVADDKVSTMVGWTLATDCPKWVC